MAVEWEYVGDYTLDRSVEIVPLLSEDDEEFGGSEVFEEFAPTETHTFRATGLTWAECESIIGAAKVRLSTTSITDKLSRSFSGYATSISATNIDGTTLFQLQLTLQVPPPEPTP